MFRPYALTLLAALLLSPSAATAQQEPAFEVLQALPQDTDGTLNIEAVLLLKDLHRLDRFYRTMKERLERFEIGKAYFASAHQKALLGLDLYGEIARLAQLTTPSGKPSSAALAVYSNKGQFGVQLILRAEAGFAERVQKELSGDDPPPWKMSFDGDRVTIPVMEGMQLVGQIDDGWLRLAPEESMLIGSQGGVTELYSAKLAPYVERSELVLLLRQGMGTEMLGGFVSDPTAQGLASSLKGAMLGVELDDKTSVMTVAVESEALAQYAPMARKPGLANWFVPMLDSQAASVFSLSLPPAALALAGELAKESPLEEIPGGAKLASLIGEIDGRIGFIGFDTPGDWALAMRFNSPESAAAFAPALQKVIDEGVKALGVKAQDFARIEEFPGTGGALHLRPDELIDGWRITAFGSNVVTVPRSARLARLAALNGGNPGKGKKKKDVPSAMIAGPLTPLVKRTLDTPAIALAYTLVGGDGAIFDYLILPSKAISVGVEVAKNTLGDDPEIKRMVDLGTLGLERLPLSVAVGMVGWLTTYDFAAAIDVRDTVLVLELVSSQI